MLVHIIADYGHGDLAFAEVVQRIKLHLPDAEPVLTPVPPFATIAAGFCIAQLGLNPAPVGTIIYHNVAPREDDAEARTNNAVERLAFGALRGGGRVAGVSAGPAYSFVGVAAGEVGGAGVPAEGSQFRSRDLFPQAAAAIAVGEPDALDTKIDRTDIPDVPRNRVAYVDGYGNIKTSIPSRGGKKTLKVRVRIGGAEMEAIASDGSFAVEPGQLAFAPGSSGWPAPTADGKGKGGEVRWMELFLRGGNAWEAFGKPAV